MKTYSRRYPRAVRIARRCAFCLGRLVPKSTGRPRRYCKDACRQAGFRRVTKLRARTAERVLAEHGLDGDRLCAFVYRCLQSNLNRRGAYLAEERFQDCLDYLVLAAITTAAKYDPTRSRPGTYKFESYLWDILEKRVIDWWRVNIGDLRFPELLERKAAFRSPLPLDPMDEGAHNGERALSAEDEYDLSMSNAVAELGQALSEEARWTLENLGRALAEGASIAEASAGAGLTMQRAKRQLEELREEMLVRGDR